MLTYAEVIGQFFNCEAAMTEDRRRDLLWYVVQHLDDFLRWLLTQREHEKELFSLSVHLAAHLRQGDLPWIEYLERVEELTDIEERQRRLIILAMTVIRVGDVNTLEATFAHHLQHCMMPLLTRGTHDLILPRRVRSHTRMGGRL